MPRAAPTEGTKLRTKGQFHLKFTCL